MEDSLKIAIQEMKNGEEKGFNKVYSATYNRVYFKAKQFMKKEEDAQDLTQIVFIEAYKNIHTLQAPEALFSWLDGITYNQSMKIYRKRRDVLLTEEAEGIFDTLENNDIASMPELTADQKATADIIKGIIEELPALQKAAVIAYYFDGFKVEQIAEMMECSVNTIKSRLNYARKYIKERVEEKEKKEGYRLHAFGLPVLWFSIKMLAEKTTLTVKAAQGIYNRACSSVGLEATAISAGGAGTIGAGTAGTVAGEAAKAAGIGAKFASLTTAAKALIIAGSVVVVGLGTAGVVSLVNDDKTEMVIEEAIEESTGENIVTDMNVENIIIKEDLSEYLTIYHSLDSNKILYATKISDTKYIFYTEDIEKVFDENEKVYVQSLLPDTWKLSHAYIGDEEPDVVAENRARAINKYKNVGYEVVYGEDVIILINYAENIPSVEDETKEVEMQEPFELTESAQRQISAFVAAAYQCNYSSVNNGRGWNIFSMSPDDCLLFVNDYIGMVNYYWTEDVMPNKDDLPYDWYRYGVNKEEIADFCKYGLGIEIPSDYSYSYENDGGAIKIADEELFSSFDARTIQVTGGNVEIVSQDENSIILSGTCYWYDPEETEYQFTISGVPSGNTDVFGGLTITNIEITETSHEVNKENSASTGGDGQGVHLTNSGTTWQLTDTVSMHFENGVFTVSGTGDMPDYNAKGEVAPWMYDVFRGDPTTVIIEEGITSITPMAFSGYLNITEVSLPSSLRKIGDRAFSSCNSLEEIVIPDGVEEIGDKVFFNSYSLKKIEIPASVTEIGDGIFMSGNSNLVIYGEKDSAAERYAKKWEISFVEK